MTSDSELLRTKLIKILDRMVTVEEMREALGLKASTYYDQLREGRLLSLNNLKVLADNLGVNEIQLFVECGLLDPEALDKYNQMVGVHPMKLATQQEVRHG